MPKSASGCATLEAPAGKMVISDVLPQTDCTPASKFDGTKGAAIVWQDRPGY